MDDDMEIIERRSSPSWQDEIARLEKMFGKHYIIDEEMHRTTTALLSDIQQDMKTVKEIVSAWNNIKGWSTVMRVVGSIIKWSAGVAAAGVGLWLLLKGGK